MIKIKHNNNEIDFTTAEWSGTSTQCSRTLTFSIPWNPYDKEYTQMDIKLGDLISLYEDEKLLFLGTVTTREKSAAIGTASFTAMDFMHHLLRSNITKKFKKTTPEKITTNICKMVGVPTKNLYKTKTNIDMIFFEDACIYDIIMRVYRMAKASTAKIFMPIMDGKNVSVIEKGLPSGVTLTQGVDVTDASYSDTVDNMVDRVEIYNEKGKKLGEVANKKNVTSYGVYQSTYTKEKGVNAKKAARALLQGITKEVNISGLIGDVRAISGYSVVVSDISIGVSGTFFISSDTHRFENGIHTMELELAYRNIPEEGAEEQDKEEEKPKEINSRKCFYLDNSTVYHSSKSCPSCGKKKKFKQSTVKQMKKIKITSGKNKGKRKYKPCLKCWEV